MFNSSSNNRGRDMSPGLPPAPQPQQSNAQGKRGMFSVIGPDVVITGNVAASADLHIDGRIDGDVNCGSLVQGSESRIKGSVKAEAARLAGSIEGAVSVKQLTIERAARITGDVEYETIAIENGASIDGRLKHVSAEAAARPAPVMSAVPTHAPEMIAYPTAAGEAA
jgi:cytoskeletal protein CcmA (bactofilin family)